VKRWLVGFAFVAGLLLFARADSNVSQPYQIAAKRTGTTVLSPNYASSHITSKTTTTITASTAYVSTLVISCSAAGSSWTLSVQDGEATAKILVPSFTLTVPTNGQPIVLNFQEPIVMTTGIQVVTAGTTAGTVDVFATYWQ